MTSLDRRQNDAMRITVHVALRHKNILGPYKAARFLYANSVPLSVALRVLTRK